MSHYALATFVMLCATIAFYPMTQPAELTSNALNASRIAELGLLTLAAGTMTVAILLRRCPISLVSRAPIIAFAFVVWAMLSSIWSVNPILSLGRGITLMLLLYIATGLTVYIRDISSDSMRATLIIMTSALLASIVVLLLSNLIIWGTLLNFSEDVSWSGRPGRLFFARSGPLDTGELLSLTIIMAALSIRRLGPKTLIIGGLFWLLYLTDARNLIAFVPLALAIGFFQRGSIQLRFVLISAMACGLVVLIVFALSGDLAKILPIDFWTLNGRTPLWGIASGYIADNPFLGVGYYASRYFLMNSHFFAGHAHNAYVETAMSLGLIGLSLLLAFLVYCVRVSFADRSGFLTTILVLCVLGSAFNPLILASNPHTLYLFSILLIVAENVSRQRTVRTPDPMVWREPVELR
jgi:O-antigen ligase